MPEQISSGTDSLCQERGRAPGRGEGHEVRPRGFEAAFGSADATEEVARGWAMPRWRNLLIRRGTRGRLH
jgi:hypothetical protein